MRKWRSEKGKKGREKGKKKKANEIEKRRSEEVTKWETKKVQLLLDVNVHVNVSVTRSPEEKRPEEHHRCRSAPIVARQQPSPHPRHLSSLRRPRTAWAPTIHRTRWRSATWDPTPARGLEQVEQPPRLPVIQYVVPRYYIQQKETTTADTNVGENNAHEDLAFFYFEKISSSDNNSSSNNNCHHHPESGREGEREREREKRKASDNKQKTKTQRSPLHDLPEKKKKRKWKEKEKKRQALPPASWLRLRR